MTVSRAGAKNFWAFVSLFVVGIPVVASTRVSRRLRGGTMFVSVQGAGQAEAGNHARPLSPDFFENGDGYVQKDQPVANRPWVQKDNAGLYQHPWIAADGSGVPELDSSFSLRLAIWHERAANVTLGCNKPGCTATTVLLAFDGNTEIGRHCSMNLNVHPTDFDDQYSGERVEFVRINGITVNMDCFPMRSGCNESTQQATFPCMTDFSLNEIMNETGILEITAKIPTVVDECPYQGNYLSAVPTVTCLVTPKPTPPPPAPAGVMARPSSVERTYVIKRAPFRCPDRGCQASALLSPWDVDAQTHPVNMSLVDAAVTFSSCSLSVNIYQTDFDQSDGTNETVEYVRIANVTAASNIVPGHNPCRAKWAGTPMSDTSIIFPAVSAFDVTQAVTEAKPILVEAKISPHVDECGYDGYLLNGFAVLNCSFTFASQAEEGSMPLAGETTVAPPRETTSSIATGTETETTAAPAERTTSTLGDESTTASAGGTASTPGANVTAAPAGDAALFRGSDTTVGSEGRTASTSGAATTSSIATGTETETTAAPAERTTSTLGDESTTASAGGTASTPGANVTAAPAGDAALLHGSDTTVGSEGRTASTSGAATTASLARGTASTSGAQTTAPGPSTTTAFGSSNTTTAALAFLEQ
eukprot:TRINITY_DN3107_c0_g1_i1.p1 TRINITY_DN3107_c0_g1~~TRINITY_DN3107_c0_g1_i1.p1  ORF type:complete len:646 (-),score=79.84 TRINITY_DN3107_c0_g1_i1:281-2218(-)